MSVRVVPEKQNQQEIYIYNEFYGKEVTDTIVKTGSASPKFVGLSLKKGKLELSNWKFFSMEA